MHINIPKPPTRLHQKRMLVADKILSHYEAYDLPRGGRRNPFHFPGVCAISVYRTRASRRLERELGYLTFPALVSSDLKNRLALPSLVVIAGENRYYSDAPGKDVIFFGMRDTHVPAFQEVIHEVVVKRGLVSPGQYTFHRSVPARHAPYLIQYMFDCDSSGGRGVGNLIWA